MKVIHVEHLSEEVQQWLQWLWSNISLTAWVKALNDLQADWSDMLRGCDQQASLLMMICKGGSSIFETQQNDREQSWGS